MYSSPSLTKRAILFSKLTWKCRVDMYSRNVLICRLNNACQLRPFVYCVDYAWLQTISNIYTCRSDYRTASERNVTVTCLISSYTDSFTSIFDDMHTAYVKYHFYASLLVNSVAILWCHMWFRLLRIYNLSNGEKVQIKLVTFYIRSGGSRQQTQFH